MTSLKTRGFYYKLYSLLPIIILFISVLNEFDFNYLNLDYFSFNFPFILIFFFTLKEFKNFDYLLVFFAGLITSVLISIHPIIGIWMFGIILFFGFLDLIKSEIKENSELVIYFLQFEILNFSSVNKTILTDVNFDELSL